MNADALRTLLRQQPFQPFDLVLSSGDRLRVPHPEMLLLLQNRVLVALPPKAGGRRLPDEYVTVSYLHMAAARPVESRRAARKK
jgi:hypothetical protein